MSANSILDQVARITSCMDVITLPREVVERTKLAILDALEASCDGAEIPGGGQQVYAAIEKRQEGATLYGKEPASDVDDAIFYNIVTASYSARNDIHTEGRVHPGLTLIPTVLGEAEARHLDGKSVLAAVVAGYETMIRMGLVVQKGKTYPLSSSLRASMLAAPLGNAFALSRLLGLDTEQTANAAALALNHLCGVNQWRIESTGEDAYQNAWDALNARACVRFAAAGLVGAKGNLDGKHGFLSLFAAEDQAHMLIDGLGSDYELLRTRSKPVGACVRLLAPCQLAQDLLEDPAFHLDGLEHIEVNVTERVARNPWFSNKSIIGQSSAINSIPYGIAAVLLAGNIHDVTWYPPYPEEAMALMDKIDLVYDDYSQRLEPQGCRLIAAMKDGITLVKERLAFAPLQAHEIEQRFLSTAERRFGSDRASKMLSLARDLEHLEDVSVFTRLFRKQA